MVFYIRNIRILPKLEKAVSVEHCYFARSPDGGVEKTNCSYSPDMCRHRSRSGRGRFARRRAAPPRRLAPSLPPPPVRFRFSPSRERTQLAAPPLSLLRRGPRIPSRRRRRHCSHGHSLARRFLESQRSLPPPAIQETGWVEQSSLEIGFLAHGKSTSRRRGDKGP